MGTVVLGRFHLIAASQLLINRVTVYMEKNFTCPVRALSLTTPTVSRDFVRIFSVYEHTFPAARESRL